KRKKKDEGKSETSHKYDINKCDVKSHENITNGSSKAQRIEWQVKRLEHEPGMAEYEEMESA
ncbi:unnamed protein product, partial [Ceratitis capitata]